MSTATEIANAEALPDDETLDDDDNPGDDNPLDPADPPPPAAAVDAVKLTKALDREGERHNLAFLKIVGDDGVLYSVCPLCSPSTAGYVLPIEALPAEVQGELRTAVEDYLYPGNARLESFAEAADMVTCDVCGGEGLVRSGSKHPEHVLEVCNPCRGNGWRAKAVEAAAPITVAPAPVAYPPYTPPPVVEPLTGTQTYGPDFAGRPWGDPMYGQPIPVP